MAEKQTGSNLSKYLFLIFFSAITLIGLSFLGIWAFHNNSVRGGVIVSIFGLMTLVGLLFFNIRDFNAGGWGANSVSFVIGFLIWIIIGSSGGTAKSILSVSDNNLFATISSELPLGLEFTLNSFVIPVSEEIFFLFGLPALIIMFMEVGKDKWKWLGNKAVQIIAISVISGALFAAFHVGKFFLAFIIAAFLFRALMITSVLGDKWFNVINGLNVVSGLAIGAHIGNNWASFGFARGVEILNTNFFTFGWLIYGVLGIIFLSALNEIGVLILNGKSKSEVFGNGK